MSTLVIGAAGQVGMDVLLRLGGSGVGQTIHAADIARPDRSPPHVAWHALDITEPEAVVEMVARLRPQRIIHLAAMLSARSEQQPQKAYAVNQTGTFNVLEAARQGGVEQVIFASSIAVYGPGLDELVTDDHPTRPTTIYGISKVGGELLGAYYHRRFGLDFRAVRFPGLISPTEPGGGTSDYALRMFVETIRTGAYESYCRPDTRIPLMYMPDAVRGLLELADVPAQRLSRRIYNIAAFSPTAQELADRITRLVPHARITFQPDQQRQAILDSWPRRLDDSPARRDWGWQPAYDLERMCRAMVEAVRGLPDGKEVPRL